MQKDRIVELIEEIIKSPGTSMPLDLAHELMDELSDATLICPSIGKEGIMLLQLGERVFLPASCNMADFKRIFKNETPLKLDFKEILTFLNANVDGIMLNPGSFGFIINPALAGMISDKIKDNDSHVSKG